MSKCRTWTPPSSLGGTIVFLNSLPSYAMESFLTNKDICSEVRIIWNIFSFMIVGGGQGGDCWRQHAYQVWLPVKHRSGYTSYSLHTALGQRPLTDVKRRIITLKHYNTTSLPDLSFPEECFEKCEYSLQSQPIECQITFIFRERFLVGADIT